MTNRLHAARSFAMLLGLGLCSGAIACPVELLQRARGSTEAAHAHAAILAAGLACSGAQREWAGRLAAAHHLAAAEALLSAGRAPMEVLTAVEAALTYAPLWQAFALRGDLHLRLADGREQVDFAAASLDFQRALNEIALGDERSDPVPTATIAALFRKAEQTRLLADRPVASPALRSGAPGGLASRRIRSFAPASVAMPIQFEFDSSKPTAGGALAVEDLWQMLDAEGRPRIRLVGHTDPEGPARYNLDLSRRRAQAVRDILVARGYDAAKIEADGMGESAPLPIEEHDGYSPAQIHQILRRVELIRR